MFTPIDTDTPEFTPTPSHTPTITPTRTPHPTRTPLPSPTPIREGTILIDEDFEDGFAQGFSDESDNWEIVDETQAANKVYEAKTVSGEYSFAAFGSEGWKNYAIEFRFRVIDCAQCDGVEMLFRINDTLEALYELLIPYNPNRGFLLGSQATDWTSWQELLFQEYLLNSDIWYKVRVEAQGNDIRVFVNNEPLFATSDTRVNAGRFAISPLPNTHAQFDDIKVTSLGDD
jgi:pectate lyase